MEEIEVTARFCPKGKINPLNFIWQGITYKVVSIGRNWNIKDSYHVLVMDVSNQVYHLIFNQITTQWYLLHSLENRHMPRA
jgi:hypothetical protein